MTRVVRAADGRSWTVRSEINWSQPYTAQEFETDVAAGQVAGLVMLAIILVLILTVVFWTPSTVVIPGWLLVVFLVAFLLLPMQWVMNRPWTIVADTPEPVETAGEHWVGTVRGLWTSRAETSRVARHLEMHAVPDDGRGRLQPVY